MADNDPTNLPSLSPEQRQQAAAQFEQANQAITSGNYDFGIKLLLNCCKLDPANLTFRQTLRRTEKTKYRNNLRGSRLAWLTTAAAKARIRGAKRSRDYLKVLEHGEEVLSRNPWDTGVQMDMAEAADAQGLLPLAIWSLEQARQKDPELAPLNRSLARLYEKCGNFTEAIALWELVRKADPSDIEASHKAKELTASARPPAPAVTSVPAKEAEALPAEPAEAIGQEEADLRARIQVEPTRPGGYLDLAGYYRRVGQLEKARAVLCEGLGPTGQHFQLTLELAELDLEPFRRNLVITEEKLRSDPHQDELLQIRHGLRKEINTRETDLFRMKADRFPTEMSHRLELGLRLLRGGQLDEAITELQTARAAAPLAWRALTYIGYCHLNRGNWRLARRHFHDALQAMPPEEISARKELLFALAQGSADAGEWSEAVDRGHELVALDAGYRDIGRLLQEWQARLQQA
jgi:tetratricopeptide (TPR) repeat protein